MNVEHLVYVDFHVGENHFNLHIHLVESLVLVAFIYMRRNWAVLLSLTFKLKWQNQTHVNYFHIVIWLNFNGH